MTRNGKTKINLLGPHAVWHPPRGAPKGNRNAARPLATIRAKIKSIRARARALTKACQFNNP